MKTTDCCGTVRVGDSQTRKVHVSLQDVNDGPKLSPEGERLLRTALERRAGQTRWDTDVLHVDDPTSEEPPASSGESSRGLLTAMSVGVAIVLVGLLVAIGALAGPSEGGSTVAEPTVGDTGLDPIDPSVLGRTETAVAESERTSPTVDTADEDALDFTAPEPASPAPELLGTMELQAYATGESSVASFVVRARQIGGETIETAHLSIAVVTAEGPTPATLQFEQLDLPAGSSAVALVRLADPLTNSATLQLLYDGQTVAEAELTLAND